MADPLTEPGRLAIDPDSALDDVVVAVRRWVEEQVPAAWREAALRGGRAAIREVRSREAYESWYPVFGRSGLVVPTWPREYGGLGLPPGAARAIEAELGAYNLGRLNPLGLNLAAPALFAYGTEEQRRRFLPPIVRNEEVWCQLFSEPGAGSDLASLSTRAERDGDAWVVSGQKVWNTWAHLADWAVLLARTDPDVVKRRGLTYFLVDMRRPGIEVRPLRHLGGEIDFDEVFLDGVQVPDGQRVGAVGDGWRVANATLSGERQMVSGSGSGGVDRIGGTGVDGLLALADADGPEPGCGPAPGVDGCVQRGAHPRVDQSTGPGRSEGRPPAGTRELDRQGPSRRAQSAHAAPGCESAGSRSDCLAERCGGLRLVIAL